MAAQLRHDKNNNYSLFFADDGFLMALTKNTLEKIMNVIVLRLREVGFEVNIEKCSWGILYKYSVRPGDKLIIDNQELLCSEKTEVRVRGAHLNGQGNTMKTILKRVESAWNYFFQRKDVFKSRAVSMEKRVSCMLKAIRPVLFWGRECWKLEERDLEID